MRTVPQSMTDAWKAEDKTGDRRPVVRAQIQHSWLQRIPYDTADAPGGPQGTERHRHGVFTTIIFGDPTGGTELRNIKSCAWNRSVNSDVAECTLTLKNTDLTPIGNQEELAHADDFDQPGIMSPGRGPNALIGSTDPNPWGYNTDTGWSNRLQPDRVVRTYEGYGTDPTVVPALDPNLIQSGTWIIDEVTLNSEGDIELKMRDIGRVLLDQIVFPPVVPYAEYPLTWTKIHTENVDGRDVKGGSWVSLTDASGKATSSNSKYIGRGLTNPPYDRYVGPTGGVNGHHPAHVLENRDGAYWWSTGQETPNSKVWWQIDLDDPKALNGIRLKPKGGPYRVYISLKGPNGWIGRRTIPYDVTTGGVNVKADIPFVYSTVADKNLRFDAILKRKYGAIESIRITFTKLTDTETGTYPFFAGLSDIAIYTGAKADLDFTKGKYLKTVGNYTDYTDIVKWVCAWGGFFWPPHSTGLDFIRYGGENHTYTYASPDSVLPKGRVWGDFMNSGTAGQFPGGDLTPDLFDKQPLMNVINYVRDLLGFIFFIDETGGAVWRLPNIGLAGAPKLGNYLSPTHLGTPTNRARTSDIVVIDEAETLRSYSTTFSGANLRERIFVANTTGKIGTVIKGFSGDRRGLRRVAGWTDQHFETKKECRVMADMIAARQMFSYRRSRVSIAGYPAIQIDDQVRIFERVTNETYYHYVEGVSSNLNMETGKWTYDLETHWLGESPTDAWAVKVDQLDTATQNYLGTVN